MNRIITPSLTILILFVFGGVLFKMTAPDTCGPLRNDDSIFVLTGDARRIPAGVKLLRNHPDRRMYIVGVGAPKYDIVRVYAHQIETESKSKTTYQNALAVKYLAGLSDLRRVVLLTSVDHMPRAMLLLRRQMPDAEIVPCAVPLHGTPAPMRLERWGAEYLKYLGTVVGIYQKS